MVNYLTVSSIQMSDKFRIHGTFGCIAFTLFCIAFLLVIVGTISDTFLFGIGCPDPYTNCSSYICDYVKIAPGTYHIIVNDTPTAPGCSPEWGYIKTPPNNSSNQPWICSTYAGANSDPACKLGLPPNGTRCYPNYQGFYIPGAPPPAFCPFSTYCYNPQPASDCSNRNFQQVLTIILITSGTLAGLAFIFLGVGAYIGMRCNNSGETVRLYTDESR